jgi:hypothetical protein
VLQILLPFLVSEALVIDGTLEFTIRENGTTGEP